MSREGAAYVTPPPVPYDAHERLIMGVIEDRDAAEDWADRIAAAFVPADVLGEHSSHNNPWQNALDYAATLPSPGGTS